MTPKILPFTAAQIEQIADQIPTPFHIYDEKGIRENARNLLRLFSWNKGFKEYFAVKATPNPFILKILKHEGFGVDCSSLPELMLAEAVGILGGEPKCCKSFLALDMAVSVASGAPCLRQFAVSRTGPVLLFPAEDSLSVVRERLEGICRASGTRIEELPIYVITAPRLLLDVPQDRQRLRATVEAIRPALLVLDPFIRLHRADENASKEVAPLLGYLRELQREFETAVLLVHHARKGSGKGRPGQALRGSSDLHGWGDSNLYLRRVRDRLVLLSEHRAAPASPAVSLELVTTDAATTHLGVVSEPQSDRQSNLQEQVLACLVQGEAFTRAKLRDVLSVQNQRLGEALETLERAGKIRRSPAGWQRVG